jgi:quercetin dioxygenase-like cupin family protein
MTNDTPTYLKTHKLRGRSLNFDVATAEMEQIEKARASRSGRVATTLAKQGPLRLTLVAMRKGARLQEHRVEGPATFHCLRGKLQFDLGDGSVELRKGTVLALDAGVSHTVTAASDSSFLITLSQGPA